MSDLPMELSMLMWATILYVVQIMAAALAADIQNGCPGCPGLPDQPCCLCTVLYRRCESIENPGLLWWYRRYGNDYRTSVLIIAKWPTRITIFSKNILLHSLRQRLLFTEAWVSRLFY